jgi:two-component system, OmpR family, response regulator
VKKELRKILHVEDEADIREITKLALEAVGGFVVESCASGQEALKIAPMFQPDLVLLDVMMPGMDGPATLRAMNKLSEFDDLPVIFMTAKIQRSEILGYGELGAAGVITKPFDPMTLSNQILKIWQSSTSQTVC